MQWERQLGMLVARLQFTLALGVSIMPRNDLDFKYLKRGYFSSKMPANLANVRSTSYCDGRYV
jgi:hypothetical protein